MERSESKDEKNQLCLSIIGQRKYFIKEYLNKVFDSIPVYISRDVGAMEILEIFLKESLINKHDLNLFAREESYFYECVQMDSILFLQNWGRLYKALRNTYQVDDSFFFYFSSKLESGDSYAVSYRPTPSINLHQSFLSLSQNKDHGILDIRLFQNPLQRIHRFGR